MLFGLLELNKIVCPFCNVFCYVAKDYSVGGRQFVGFQKGYQRIQKELGAIQNKEDEILLYIEWGLKQDLNRVLAEEEMLWKQHMKTFWLKEGDENTRFFHS